MGGIVGGIMDRIMGGIISGLVGGIIGEGIGGTIGWSIDGDARLATAMSAPINYMDLSSDIHSSGKPEQFCG